MFPLQRSKELVIPSSSVSGQQYQIHQDLGMGQASLEVENSHLQANKVGKRQRDLLHIPENNGEGTGDSQQKKIMHRDIERQRRQEMASLFASLRSLLPLEYIKGKRSISDHTHGAVNYIRHLERKIKELGIRRDKLKQLGNSSFAHHANRSSRCMPNCVAVNPCWAGAQIFISSSFKEEVFPLSRVLEVLLEEGLTVISCVSTKANERLLHAIHTEIGEMMFVDLTALQNKLTALINM